MSKDYEQITRGVSASLRSFRKNEPELMGSFDAMAAAALRDGVLD